MSRPPVPLPSIRDIFPGEYTPHPITSTSSQGHAGSRDVHPWKPQTFCQPVHVHAGESSHLRSTTPQHPHSPSHTPLAPVTTNSLPTFSSTNHPHRPHHPARPQSPPHAHSRCRPPQNNPATPSTSSVQTPSPPPSNMWLRAPPSVREHPRPPHHPIPACTAPPPSSASQCPQQNNANHAIVHLTVPCARSSPIPENGITPYTLSLRRSHVKPILSISALPPRRSSPFLYRTIPCPQPHSSPQMADVSICDQRSLAPPYKAKAGERSTNAHTVENVSTVRVA